MIWLTVLRIQSATLSHKLEEVEDAALMCFQADETEATSFICVFCFWPKILHQSSPESQQQLRSYVFPPLSQGYFIQGSSNWNMTSALLFLFALLGTVTQDKTFW